VSTDMETQPTNERRTLYIVMAVIVAALAVGGLIAYRSAKSTQEAEQKADQLITELQNQGARTPSKDQIVRVLGDDGGAVCAHPDDALNHAIYYGMLTNGAAGPGIRPVIADNKAVQGQLLIMKVYCPDELAGVQEWLNDLKFADVVNE
jgi:hypothetical protein